MKRSTIGDIIQFLIAALVAAVVAIWADRHFGGRENPSGGETSVQIDSVKTQIDTTTAVAPEPAEIRHDTIYIRVPVRPESVPNISENVPELPESVPELPETVPELPDSTIYIPLVLEQKVYEDPDSTYRAVVSGPAIDKYGPRLDSIKVYSRKEVVYQTQRVYVEPPHWSWGISGGVVVTAEGIRPGITFGVQYRLGDFRKRNK